ncbi:globin family protein [Leptothoe kymatousa]|uniref:Uncharacterized protein n=1 Tax=Leptothoe kymatousa TAU-MAC 1615 TaxID=2364775 RepID=A0ABS5Y186_9CYAN|nr:hypothetical protein [Leptothoe kymatousa]MBT9311550.1 hypothetical protein [Leptothoe kymatousa TAU-MAC 1615]
MISSSLRSQRYSAKPLVDIWTARYSCAPLSGGATPTQFEDAISAKGRRRTVERLHGRFIKQSCRRAAIRTSDLYTCYKDSNLGEIAELAKFAIQVYDVLLQFYQVHTPALVNIAEQQNGIVRGSTQRVFQIPEIVSLITDIEPLLLEFHAQQTIEEHWQTRSFLSTQLSFSSWFLLKVLPKEEQVLLGAYFYFLEEYVSMPWHRLYKAATTHDPSSPILYLAERMLPQIAPVSMQVYTQWSKLFGGYYNRRGQLDNSGVRHSSLRDFSMFQVYLWLCILQGDLGAIEQELVVLCSRVYRGIGIPWEMTVKGTKLLVDEILSGLDTEEKALISPYTAGMLRAFERQP